jgi:hypothetical protein
VTSKALKLHLQSIRLQKSFYSSNFCSFTCGVMWFAKFQVFLVSTILILEIMFNRARSWGSECMRCTRT